MSKSLNSLSDTAIPISQSPRQAIRNLLDSMSTLENSECTRNSESADSKDIIKSYLAYSTPTKKKHLRPSVEQDYPEKIIKESISDDKKGSNCSSSRKKMLLSAMRKTQYNSPRKKEIDEAYAFANSARNYYGVNGIDVVIDVAGGHGALAALILMSTSAREAIVVDPAMCASGVKGVAAAWGHLYSDKILRYRNEDLESCLADEIQKMRSKYGITSDRILVVACHACQHLTSDTLEIARSEGVNVCVMPCCQKDTTGGSIKSFAKSLSIDIGIVMDIMTAGEMSNYYTVRLKLIDASITPQNRMIMCKVREHGDRRDNERSRARLRSAYHAAHRMDTTAVSPEVLEHGKHGNGFRGENGALVITLHGLVTWKFVIVTSAISAISGALLAAVYMKQYKQ